MDLPPDAIFTAFPVEGTVPLTVTLTNGSNGSITSQNRDFGDGNTSNEQSPTHAYTTLGTYTVVLTVNGPSGTDTETTHITVTHPAPIAAFTASAISGTIPFTTTFTDGSTDPVTSWNRDFGDGNTSNDQNPTHNYATPGTYTVTLTVNGPGGTDTETTHITVNHSEPVAAFTASSIDGTAPLTVTFTNKSIGNITSQEWDFGDGNTSNEQSPTHRYTTPGIYTVALTVSGPGGNNTRTKINHITVDHPAPVAAFTASAISGTIPFTTTFTDGSTGPVASWNWDFGDGNTSNDQSPTYAYTTPGTYTVTLTVNGLGGTDTETTHITVTHPEPVAAFTASAISGTIPFTTTFTDGLTGPITSWDWDFGDGNVSGARHPEHVYQEGGVYTVTLTVTGPGGSDTETKVAEITVTHPEPVADFDASAIYGTAPFTATFTDLSTGAITHWNWEFDGDHVSGARHPEHGFTVPGTYPVTLTVTGPGGSDSKTITVTVTDPSDARTLILTNRQKIATEHSETQAVRVMGKLAELAAHPNVNGTIIQVESVPNVADAYTQWEANPTSVEHANDVTAAIKEVINTQLVEYAAVEYIVIVGDDQVIPFHRVRDRTGYPESRYSSKVSCDSATGSALCQRMTLGDDYYAARVPTVPKSCRWDGHDLYLPHFALSRLIETPDGIIDQIDAFLTSDSVTANDAIVTGYDFVKDAARKEVQMLEEGDITTDGTLIGEQWGQDDFISKVLGTPHDVISVNGHADHRGIGTPSGTVSADDIADAANQTGSLFYTVG